MGEFRKEQMHGLKSKVAPMGTTGQRIKTKQNMDYGTYLVRMMSHRRFLSRRIASSEMMVKEIIRTEKHHNIIVKSSRSGASPSEVQSRQL